MFIDICWLCCTCVSLDRNTQLSALCWQENFTLHLHKHAENKSYDAVKLS